MALKMRLRPGERLAINGAVIRNPGGKAVEVEILNEATLLHERDIMLPEDAKAPLDLLYFLVQSMHIEPNGYDTHYKDFVKASSDLYAASYAAGDDGACTLVNELVLAVGQRNFVGGLKLLQKQIGRPGDRRRGGDGGVAGQSGDP